MLEKQQFDISSFVDPLDANCLDVPKTLNLFCFNSHQVSPGIFCLIALYALVSDLLLLIESMSL